MPWCVQRPKALYMGMRTCKIRWRGTQTSQRSGIIIGMLAVLTRQIPCLLRSWILGDLLCIGRPRHIAPNGWHTRTRLPRLDQSFIGSILMSKLAWVATLCGRDAMIPPRLWGGRWPMRLPQVRRALPRVHGAQKRTYLRPRSSMARGFHLHMYPLCETTYVGPGPASSVRMAARRERKASVDMDMRFSMRSVLR